MKAVIQKALRRFGYILERHIPESSKKLDVFDLAVRYHAPSAKSGWVIQVGANDGVSHDPIHDYLVEFDWNALLIEPNPVAFRLLQENYAGRDLVRFENVAIGSEVEKQTLYVANVDGRDTTGQASFERAHVARFYGPGVEINALEVDAMTPSSLIKKHLIDDIFLLQIDTEGFDYEVIKLFEPVGIKPQIIHFEHCHLVPEVRVECFEYLCSRGYALSHTVMDTVAVLEAKTC